MVYDTRNEVRVLADMARAVHASLDLHSRLEWVVDAARELTGAGFAGYVTASDPPRIEAIVGTPQGDLELFAKLTMSAIVTRSTDAAEIVRVGDLEIDPRFHDKRRMVPAGVASWLAVPVVAVEGTPHGAIVMGHPEAERFDDRMEIAVTALAAHLGVALDNLATVTRLAELEAAQREVVHQLQEAVRPPQPSGEAAELGVHYLPADPSAPTGGDLYDWLVLPDGDLHIAVVDVMGKGVAATKEALSLTHAIRLLVLDGCPLDRVVARADALVTAQSPDVVATIIVLRYRPSDGVVHLVGAGHPPALLVSPVGTTRYVAAPGVPIGWPGAGSSEMVTLTLQRSETLVLYTDGLIEATKDILQGLEGLALAAADTARYPAGPMARALVDRALAGAMRRDDSLALVLRRRTPPPPTMSHPLGPLEYRFSPNTASVPLVRHLFRDWLDHLAIDRSESADLTLAASELCANAVHHGSGVPGSLVLRAFSDEHDVVIEVEDDGAGFDISARLGAEMPDPGSETGRGLYLVETLSDELTVRREEGRTVVRCRKRAVLSMPDPEPVNPRPPQGAESRA